MERGSSEAQRTESLFVAVMTCGKGAVEAGQDQVIFTHWTPGAFLHRMWCVAQCLEPGLWSPLLPFLNFG